MTIVVADDHPDTADTSALLLQMEGHRIHVAYEGAHALSLIRTLRPGAAILDLRMPQVDGFEIAQRVRQEGLTEVGLIALSGLCRPCDRERAITSGFDYFLRKPAEPAVLGRVIKELAGRRQSLSDSQT